MIRRGYILLSFVMLTVFCRGAEPMNWEQCVSYALENNLEIKKQILETESQQLSVNSAQYNYLPSINGYGNYNKNYGRSINPQSNEISNQDFFTSNYGVNASLSLFEGFIRNNRVKYEKYIYEYQKAGLESKQYAITFNILDKYFKALFFAGIREISLEQVAISNQLLQKQQKMLELGRISVSDISEIEAQLALDSLNFIQYDMNWQTSVHSLKQEMNYPITETLNLMELDRAPAVIYNQEYAFENIMSHAEQHLPEITMLKSRLEATNVRLDESKGELLPSLMLNGSWSSAFHETTQDTLGDMLSFNDQYSLNESKRVSLNLYIPIFNKLQNRTNIQKAKINCDIARSEYEAEYTNLQYGIYENVLLLESAVKRYSSSIKSEEKQMLAFESGETKLEKGLINTIDYYTLKNEYARSKAERLRSGLELFLQYKTIQYYMTGEIL